MQFGNYTDILIDFLDKTGYFSSNNVLYFMIRAAASTIIMTRNAPSAFASTAKKEGHEGAVISNQLSHL